VVVVFLSFILGVLYTFCYTVYWKIRKKLRGGESKGKKEKDGKKSLKDEAVPPQEEPPVPPFV
jgi:hypothetical protein